MPLHMVTRGAKSGPCNICGIDGPLNEDNTPPRAASAQRRWSFITSRTVSRSEGNQGEGPRLRAVPDSVRVVQQHTAWRQVRSAADRLHQSREQ